MSHHPPFKQVEAARPDFEEEPFAYTKTPAPEWVPGQGSNQLPWPVDAPFKHIDPAHEQPGLVYKLIIGGITPRPIAFVSSQDEHGKQNLAPFSYFAPCGHNPPMIVFSCSSPGPDKQKDTCNNVKTTKEFVVNIISEAFIEAANYTSIDAPADLSEWDLAGLTREPSQVVKPPRVKESAFSMECVLEHYYDMKDDEGRVTGTSLFGRVKLFHVREDVLQPNYVIDQAKLQSMSRLGGISYGRTTKGLELARPVWSVESQRKEVEQALLPVNNPGSTKADAPPS